MKVFATNINVAESSYEECGASYREDYFFNIPEFLSSILDHSE